MPVFLVLDTNYFLHFRSIDDVKWQDIINDTEVTLAIPSVCIRELEKKKAFDPRPAMQQRAAKVISRLLELTEENPSATRSRTPVIFPSAEPIDILSSHPLDRSLYDDVLIAKLLS